MTRQARRDLGCGQGSAGAFRAQVLRKVSWVYEATAHSSQADVLFLAPCFRARRFFLLNHPRMPCLGTGEMRVEDRGGEADEGPSL